MIRRLPTTLAALSLAAVFLSVPAANSALSSIPFPGAGTGDLSVRPGTYYRGQKVEFLANFPSGEAGATVTFFEETFVGSEEYDSIGTDVANSLGNAYFTDYTIGDRVRVFARTGGAGGEFTQLVLLDRSAVSFDTCGQTGDFSTDPTVVADGQAVTLKGFFPSDQDFLNVTFFRKSGDTFTPVGFDESNRLGNAYLNNYEVNGTQQLFARTSAGQCTEVQTVDPVASSALLDPKFTPAGSDDQDARARATFVPARPGAEAELQVKTIKDDVWKTIETATQNSSGVANFYISDPLEVEHRYRARSNGMATTNNVTYAGPLLDKDTGLATFHFNSNDGEPVDTRTKYFDGEFAMKGGAFNCDDEGAVQGPGEEEKAEMKGRGNYSWTFAKKGFTLKLGDKKNLCNMGDSSKWALVANHYDRSLLRNAVAYHVGKQFSNLAWTPDQVPVDLYVNGSYRGSYTLVERITADNDTPAEGGRVPIHELNGDDATEQTQPKISGGYILEWDFRHDADMNFDLGTRGWIGVKEPEDPEDPDGISDDQFRYIRNYVNSCDDKLFSSNFTDDNDNGWESCIDKASAVDYYIAMEYMKPVDGNMWASVYMYKPRRDGTGDDGDGKLRMGPLWDFDLAMGSANRAGNVVSPSSWYLRNNLGVSAQQSSKTWFNRLNEDPEFRAAVKNRWNQVDQDIDPSVFIGVNQGAIAESAEENYKKWNHDSKISQFQVIRNSWNADVGYLEDWMDERRAWMDSQLDNND
ncbi:CotH kinase family protein [Aeromicrobium sp.]|uniref:CotH kinase family protein n=1 Tax=Aeromicrobium sp. TaxID=1871063 RepID=UPI003D6AE66C